MADRENVLYIKTLAGFSIRYNGAEVAAGKLGASQICQLLLLIIHHKDTGVSRSLIKKTLFEDREIEDVSHAIRNILYNARKMLKDHGLPDAQFVRQKKGVYYWTDEIEVVEDAAEFENAYRSALLEKDPETRTEKLTDACRRYSGQFLPEIESVIWVYQEADRYREIFHDCLNELAQLLRQAHRYKDMYDIGTYAVKADPFREWETLVMEALSGLGKYAEAESYYDQVEDLYVREYGGRQNDYVKDIVRRLGELLMHNYETVGEIQAKLRLDGSQGGRGYYCSLPVFQELYRTIERTMARSGDKIFLMLCTIVDSKRNPMRDCPKLEELSGRLREALISSVRRTDTITKYGKGQYLVLLINTTRENCTVVEKRIKSLFLLKRQRTGVEFTVSNLLDGRGDLPVTH